MAWLFHLAAECGPSPGAAEALARHFHGLPLTYSGGARTVCHAEPHQDGEGNWWCVATPGGVSRGGVNSPEDEAQMAEIGALLYERLRTAPPFRYALVGIEAQEFRTFGELEQTDLSLYAFDGLVLSEELWRHLNRPAEFVPFSGGYRWRRPAG